MISEYLECGRVVSTHGCHGAVKVENLCDTPAVLASLGRVFIKKSASYEEKKIISASVFKNAVIMEIEGVSDMDAAMLLRGKVLFAARGDIPIEEGSHFIADLIGLPVKDAESGKVYGTLSDVINRGASDIYVVKTDDGEKMMPAVKEFVKSIDTTDGIFVTPIPGMLSDEDL